MKNKEDSEVELDLSKIKIKAKEIYDEEGLKRAEEALGETLKGNKHYNLLDLTLLYDGKDFSNSYDGLVKVIIPLPKGHRDKTFSCYRLTETDGKVIKVKIKAYRLIAGEKQYIGTSAVMHVVGSLNQTTTTAKNINLNKKTYTLKTGKSTQIRASIIKADRKKKLLSKEHGAKLSYISSDEDIATVTSTGRLKAKKRGKCTIYVRALNGISKAITVNIS